MTNYRIYTITNIDNTSARSWIRFSLNDTVRYSNGSYNYIDCANSYPFNVYQTWDEIEIDLNATLRETSGNTFSSTSEIRRRAVDASSMALVPVRYRNNDCVANMQELGSSSARAIGTRLLRTNESGRYIGVQMNTRTGEYNFEIVQNDPRNDHFQYHSFRRP